MSWEWKAPFLQTHCISTNETIFTTKFFIRLAFVSTSGRSNRTSSPFNCSFNSQRNICVRIMEIIWNLQDMISQNTTGKLLLKGFWELFFFYWWSKIYLRRTTVLSVVDGCGCNNIELGCGSKKMSMYLSKRWVKHCSLTVLTPPLDWFPRVKKFAGSSFISNFNF